MKSKAAKARQNPVSSVRSTAQSAVWLVGAIFFGVLPFVVSPAGLDKFRLPKDVVFAFAAVLIAAIFFASNRLRPLWRWRSWEAGLLAALVFLILHSLLLGRAEISLPAALWVSGGCVLLFVLSRSFSQASQLTLWLLLATASAINAILALLEYSGRFPLFSRTGGETLEGRTTPAGLVGDVNTGGFLFALCALILLYPLVVAKRPGLRVVAGLLIALNLTGLAVTRTLTAMVALSVVFVLWLVLYAWWVSRTRKNLRKSAIVASAVLVVALVSLLVLSIFTGSARRVAQVAWSLSRGQVSVVFAGRYPVYVITVDMIKQKPIAGWGLATFGTDFFGYRANTDMSRLQMIDQPGAFREVHNEYLQVCEELGCPGFLVFLVLLFTPIVSGFRKARQASDPKALYWWGHLSLGVLFAAVASLGFFPFHVSLTAAAIILLLAGLRWIVFEADYAGSRQSSTGPSGLSWQMAIAGVAALVVLYPVVRLWQANAELGVAEAVLNRAAASSLSGWQKRVYADTALIRLKEAERLSPTLYEGYNLQGSANMLLGNYEEAARQYQRAAEYIPSPELFTNLAVALIANKRNAEAERLLETALRYNPFYPNASWALEYLRRPRP